MIDFHCHLDLYPDPHRLVRDSRLRDLYVLSVTTTPSAWTGTNALAAGAPRIRTGLGLHPQLAHQRKGELPLFDELLPSTRYVGEVGLDGGSEFRQHWSDQLTVIAAVPLRRSLMRWKHIRTLEYRSCIGFREISAN
jgi:TatD DNase family protein